MTLQIINPKELGVPRGWNNGMLAAAGGRMLFVAGQTAADADGRVAPVGLVAQWERALERVLLVVREAGGGPEHVGRLTIYVTDLAQYHANRKQIGEVYRRLMGRHFPAMALIEVAGLVDEHALIEMEATAVI